MQYFLLWLMEAVLGETIHEDITAGDPLRIINALHKLLQNVAFGRDISVHFGLLQEVKLAVSVVTF